MAVPSGVTPPIRPPALVTLKRRAEFLRLRGGRRASEAAFVIETKPRAETAEPVEAGARFGFTVTKALGPAVVRNRIRRRLKAAVRALAGHAVDGYDYVIIARAPALDLPFQDLRRQLEHALAVVHRPGRGATAGTGPAAIAPPTAHRRGKSHA